jgi:hypothetical protein
MDNQRPDSDQGAPQGTVENDFVRPLQPMKSVSHRRLPAALPFAIAGLLVVTSVALGAGIIRQNVTPPPDASAVVVGDDNPTDTPTPVITETPTLVITEAPVVTPVPTPVPNLTLAVSLSGTQVKVEWSRYQGDNLAYYKVVRSTDGTVAWPLGDGDTLAAAISDIDQLSYVDAAPLGKTFTYEVFAVKSSADGYAVLVGSNVVAIATPEPTPTPTPKPTPAPATNCGIGSLSYSIVAPTASVGGVQPAHVVSGYTVKFSWSKYHCDNFQMYVLVRSDSSNIQVPLVSSSGNDPVNEYGDQNATSGQDDSVQAGHTYYYLVMVWTDKTFCYGGTVLAQTQVVKVVIPA